MSPCRDNRRSDRDMSFEGDCLVAIAYKADLAALLMGKDQEAAGAEVEQIAALAREALRALRASVANCA